MSRARARRRVVALVVAAVAVVVGLAGCRGGTPEQSRAEVQPSAALASVESLLGEVDRVLVSADAAMQEPGP